MRQKQKQKVQVDERPGLGSPIGQRTPTSRGGDMARGDTLHRTLRVMRLLELNPRGLTVREIADRLKEIEGIEVHLKTVRRDLEVLEQSGFPLDKTDDGTFRLAPIAQISKGISFSYEELLALYLTRETFEAQRGSPLYNNLRSFFSRLEEVLGPKAHQGLRELKRHVGIKPEPSWAAGVPAEIMETVHTACAEGQWLEIEYRAKAGNGAETRKREVGPEAIYFADAGAYLVAFDSNDHMHKLFALGRIRSAVMLDRPYQSNGFDLAEFLRDGIGVLRTGEIDDVVLKIAEPIASYVAERRWHESQSVRRVPDGIELRMHIRINEELARWVLGLGPAATIVSPQSLMNLVGDQANAIIEKSRSGIDQRKIKRVG